MKISIKFISTLFCLLGIYSGSNAQTVTDVDGNVYNTVTIGTQTWLKENLQTTRLNDNTPIDGVLGGASWEASTTPAYWTYNNLTNSDFLNTYGRMYNWYAVNTQKLCPVGWHVPTGQDWETLTAYLGGSNVAGGKLKEAGYAHWENPNTDATNSSGFTATPNGAGTKTFSGLGTYCNLWSSSLGMLDYVSNVYITYYNGDLQTSMITKKTTGNGVRCIANSNTTYTESMEHYSDMIMYPNPAVNTLYISGVDSEALISIYDLLGHLVLNENDVIGEVDISMLPKGIYMVIINSEITTCTKLVKE